MVGARIWAMRSIRRPRRAFHISRLPLRPVSSAYPRVRSGQRDQRKRPSNARHPVSASLLSRPGEQLIGIAREPIGQETEPLMNGDIEAPQIVGSGRRWLPKFRPTACPRTDRKGDNLESGLSESSHGAGHVVGGGHQQKSSFWRRMNQTGSEARVLFRSLRMFLDQDPLRGDSKRDKVLLYDCSLARAGCRGIRAPGENDPGLRVATGQVGEQVSGKRCSNGVNSMFPSGDSVPPASATNVTAGMAAPDRRRRSNMTRPSTTSAAITLEGTEKKLTNFDNAAGIARSFSATCVCHPRSEARSTSSPRVHTPSDRADGAAISAAPNVSPSAIATDAEAPVRASSLRVQPRAERSERKLARDSPSRLIAQYVPHCTPFEPSYLSQANFNQSADGSRRN